jgi:hypothetical protein
MNFILLLPEHRGIITRREIATVPLETRSIVLGYMKNGVPKFETLYKKCVGWAVGSTQRITLTVHGSSGARRSRTSVSAFYTLILLT